MTTAPVMTITEELLSDLEEKAKSATLGPWRAGNAYDKSFIPKYEVITDAPDGTYVILSGNQNFLSDAEANVAHVAAANPATILALTAHIRSLSERLEKAEKDAALFRHLMFNHVERAGDGNVLLKFGPYPEQQLRKTLSAASA